MIDGLTAYRIGGLELNLDRRDLTTAQGVIALEPRAFSVLVYLIANRRRTISQDELIEQVWPGRVIGNDALYRAIKLVRNALREAGIDNAVKTVHRVGYGFVADVEEIGAVNTTPGFVTLLAAQHSDELSERGSVAGQVLKSDGTGVLLSFQTSASALSHALALQLAGSPGIGLHVCEAVGAVPAEGADSKLPWQLAEDLARLAGSGRILLSAAAYELCRAQRDFLAELKLSWLAHGTYRFVAPVEDLTLFEVRRGESESLPAPQNDTVAIRSNTQDTILGWRAAVGQPVPGRQQWVLQDCLGSGGFGEAWLAEHARSRERRVFKFCYHSDKLRSLQREVTLFRLLRETLGVRPDIARILDWNFTEAPYFIESELTPAGDLSQWAQEAGGLASVPLETRCGLVVDVARALAAAHAVGVLHKDVKPANVLIKEGTDGALQAVLSDFGIGTITNTEPLAAHGITAQGITEALQGNSTSSRSGTRRYLAPEVLEGHPASIQADIYSLGVMAYQLLVGDLERVLAPGWERDIEDPLLRSDIAGMVDGDPDRRPADANVIAQQWSNIPDRRKMVAQQRAQEKQAARERRRRAWLIPATAALLVFALAMVWQNNRVSQALRSAQTEAKRANATAAFLNGLFDAANPLFRSGNPPSLSDLLHEGERQIERELQDEVGVKARLWTTMGRAFGALGEHDRAINLLENSAEAARVTGEPLDQFSAQLELANIFNRVGRPAEAQALLAPAIEALGARQGEASWDLLRASMLARLARADYLQGRVENAIANAAKAVEVQQRWLSPVDPDLLFTQLMAASYHIDTKDGGGDEVDQSFRAIIASYREHNPDHYGFEFALQNYGQYLQYQGRMADSEAVALESVELMRTRFGNQHPFTARALYHLGTTYGQLKRFDESEAALTESLRIRQASRGNHFDTFSSLMDLGDLYRIRGRTQLAYEHMERGLEMGVQVLGETHIAIPGSRHRLAKVLSELERLEESEALMSKACAQSSEVLGATHWRTAYCESDLAAVRARLGKSVPYDPARSALAVLESALPEGHWVRANAALNLALCLYAAGIEEEANRLYETHIDTVGASPLELAVWQAARNSI